MTLKMQINVPNITYRIWRNQTQTAETKWYYDINLPALYREYRSLLFSLSKVCEKHFVQVFNDK